MAAPDRTRRVGKPHGLRPDHFGEDRKKAQNQEAFGQTGRRATVSCLMRQSKAVRPKLLDGYPMPPVVEPLQPVPTVHEIGHVLRMRQCLHHRLRCHRWRSVCNGKDRQRAMARKDLTQHIALGREGHMRGRGCGHWHRNTLPG